MNKIASQLNALFDSAGMKYETLVYEASRINPNCTRAENNAIERDFVHDVLAALAPFKERILKFNQDDI